MQKGTRNPLYGLFWLPNLAGLTWMTHSIRQRSQRAGPGPGATISASARALEGGPLTCDNELRDSDARCWPARVRAAARLVSLSRNQTRPGAADFHVEVPVYLDPGETPARHRGRTAAATRPPHARRTPPPAAIGWCRGSASRRCRGATRACVSARPVNASPAKKYPADVLHGPLDPRLGPHRQLRPVRMTGTDVCG
jgi:hypothetical protein